MDNFGKVVEVMELNVNYEEIRTFGIFFLLMVSVQIVHYILDLPTYDFLYLVLITVLLTMGDRVSKVRFFYFTVAFFLLDLSPGMIIVTCGLFYLKQKQILNPMQQTDLKNKDGRA